MGWEDAKIRSASGSPPTTEVLPPSGGPQAPLHAPALPAPPALAARPRYLEAPGSLGPERSRTPLPSPPPRQLPALLPSRPPTRSEERSFRLYRQTLNQPHP